MNTLNEQLHRLDTWLASLGETPVWNGHVLAEKAYINTDAEGGFSLVLPCDPVTPVQYSARLEELLELGPSWLNLNALGLLRGSLLVSVEWQNPAVGISASEVSINLSGPPKVVSETPTWDLD